MSCSIFRLVRDHTDCAILASPRIRAIYRKLTEDLVHPLQKLAERTRLGPRFVPGVSSRSTPATDGGTPVTLHPLFKRPCLPGPFDPSGDGVQETNEPEPGVANPYGDDEQGTDELEPGIETSATSRKRKDSVQDSSEPAKKFKAAAPKKKKAPYTKSSRATRSMCQGYTDNTTPDRSDGGLVVTQDGSSNEAAPGSEGEDHDL